MARQIKLSKTLVAVKPEEEISQLKNEVRFLKSILHIKKSSTGGVSQLLYTVKQLQQENEALKKASMNNYSIEAVTAQNDLLRKKLIAIQSSKKDEGMSYSSGLPYLSIKNKRDFLLQRTSSSTKLYSKINNIVLEEPKQRVDMKSDINQERKTIDNRPKSSFRELPNISSSNLEGNNRNFETQNSQLEDALGLSQKSKKRFFRVETSPDRKSKFFESSPDEAHLPSLKKHNTQSDQNPTKHNGQERLLDTMSEKSESSKMTLTQFMKHQQDNTIFKESSPYKKSLQSSKSNLLSNSPKKMSFSGMSDMTQKSKYTAIKNKLGNIQKKLAQIDSGYGLIKPLLPERKPHPYGVRISENYSVNLTSIKQQMQMIDFC